MYTACAHGTQTLSFVVQLIFLLHSWKGCILNRNLIEWYVFWFHPDDESDSDAEEEQEKTVSHTYAHTQTHSGQWVQ